MYRRLPRMVSVNLSIRARSTWPGGNRGLEPLEVAAQDLRLVGRDVETLGETHAFMPYASP
jgi:hypothetical protein